MRFLRLVRARIRWRKTAVSLLLKVFFVFAALAVVFFLLGQRAQINKKKTEVEQFAKQLESQIISNENLKRRLKSSDEENLEEIKEKARGFLNLSDPDERIFVNVPAK